MLLGGFAVREIDTPAQAGHFRGWLLIRAGVSFFLFLIGVVVVDSLAAVCTDDTDGPISAGDREETT